MGITSTMRNVYVNLVSTLDLSNIARIQRKHTLCRIEHKRILKECGCIDRGSDTQLQQLDASVHAFNDRLHKLAATWYAKLREMGREKDVAVVVQPFLQGIGKSLDLSF